MMNPINQEKLLAQAESLCQQRRPADPATS